MTFKTVQPKIPIWWNEKGALLLDIQPYTGRYPEYFTHVFKLQTHWAGRGWAEIAVHKKDYPNVIQDSTT